MQDFLRVCFVLFWLCHYDCPIVFSAPLCLMLLPCLSSLCVFVLSGCDSISLLQLIHSSSSCRITTPVFTAVFPKSFSLSMWYRCYGQDYNFLMFSGVQPNLNFVCLICPATLKFVFLLFCPVVVGLAQPACPTPL